VILDFQYSTYASAKFSFSKLISKYFILQNKMSIYKYIYIYIYIHQRDAKDVILWFT